MLNRPPVSYSMGSLFCRGNYTIWFHYCALCGERSLLYVTFSRRRVKSNHTLYDFMCYLVYWPQGWLNLSWIEFSWVELIRSSSSRWVCRTKMFSFNGVFHDIHFNYSNPVWKLKSCLTSTGKEHGYFNGVGLFHRPRCRFYSLK